ncbi:DUF202 domain-containing protein [Microbacterium sp. Leaf159]|uniref:DUF202 domain-containing protein n=1 Tax=Microbacterium sp. Leaf159 TaxID=1736279 RepID=UPI0006F37B34|nr:DUF202 domain-containing protein [Microbacterium sp. Leaf159]KQR39956.1 hypothetical protein ASF80_11510 [Microbacterium sp. Leaf159]
MSEPAAIFDKGMQPERTLLAWRRTCLAFATANLIALRFTIELGGVVAVVVAVLGAGLATTAYALAAVGYRRTTASLMSEGRLAHGALALALATASTLLLGVAAGIILVLE